MTVPMFEHPEGCGGQLFESGSVAMDLAAEEHLACIFPDLLTTCLELLELCAKSATSQSLCTAKTNLKLWSSGLFGQSSLVGLDCLPATATNESLIHFIIGALADVASTLGKGH